TATPSDSKQFKTKLHSRAISETERSTSSRLRTKPAKMSLFDYFARDPWFEFQKIPSIFDQDFGRAMRLSDLVKPMFDRLRSMYFRPWRQLLSSHDDDGSDFLVDEDGFKVVLDVEQFSPSEITVKVAGNTVVVEGKHEERRDEHGYVSRHFIRRYTVPSGVHMDAVTSALSSDGVLTVSAPKVQALKEGKVRVIPITVTATPAVKSAEKVHEISKTRTESSTVKNTQKVHEIPIAKTGSTSVKNTEKVIEVPIVRRESTCVKNAEEVHGIPMVMKEYTLLKNSRNVHEIPTVRKESTVVRNTEKVHEIPIAKKDSTVVRNTEKVHEVPMIRKGSTVVKNTEKFHEIQVIRNESSGYKNVEKVHEIPIIRGESTDVLNKEEGRVHEIPITRSESVCTVCTVKTENEADDKVRDIPIAVIESPAVSIFDGERILEASFSRTGSTDFNITEVTSEKGDDD
ncbi:hypothetical protein J437_LFUL012992, partial [Ladona fulva]